MTEHTEYPEMGAPEDALSFSGKVKAELCRMPLGGLAQATAEAYGVLLYANSFSAREVRIVTESRDFAGRLERLFARAFSLQFDSAEDSSGRGRSSFSIRDADKIRQIFARFGYDAGQVLSHHINLGVLEEEQCRPAFLRGVFLAGGSVTDPGKRSHLELVTDHRNVAGETYSLLLEAELNPKETVRAGHYVLYFKRAENIEDFLTYIGAHLSAMELMSVKIEKEMRNAVNRKVNCDSANADKIVSAAQAQLEQIRRIDRSLGLDNLPGELRDVALLRIANPEASLADLAALSDPPVSKSGINHRMRKLMKL